MKLIKISLILIVILLLSSLVLAQKVGVGVYVLNLGKFDVNTGSFTVDFYLSMKCEDACSNDFEFLNGRASSIDKIIDLPNEKFYRIQANLNSPVDLRSFPFDQQLMQIIIEDKKNVIDEIEYYPIKSETSIDDSIAFTGWNIDGFKSESKKHFYNIYNETYSQYVFTIGISRIGFNSFLKTFLPVLFIILIVTCTYIMDPDKISTRLAMVSSSLVATVMFHISISNQIPPVGYLTTADKFMILTYFVLFLSFLLNIILLELQEQKRTELVEKIHRKTEYAMFIVTPVIYVLFFVIFI